MRIFISVIIVALCLKSIMTLKNILETDFQLYKNESACVAEKINSGFNRSEIITSNGTCFVKERY